MEGFVKIATTTKKKQAMKIKSLFIAMLMLLGISTTLTAAEEKGANPQNGGSFYLKNTSSTQ